MKNRNQILLSVALIVAAVVAVTGYRVLSKAPPTGNAMAMGAMSAGSPDAQGPKMLSIRDEQARRIGIAYAVAHRSLLRQSVRSVGTISFDETRLVDIDPKIEGWVDRLYVDYTGAPVRKGEPLMAVYSPMLVSAQEELILARRLADEEKGQGSAGVNAQELLAAARRRLAYWDIPADEIARVEQSGQTQKTLVLRSPADGVVTDKNVVQGARITPGMNAFKIADLSTVWVQGDVFEDQLGLVHVGQPATVTVNAYPGESFRGRVSFIAPNVDLQSRTGTVRVELPNPGERLKPGMYATVHIAVPARTPTLVVPRTAVLSTGERNIVFMREPDGMLMAHDVKLGRAVDDTVEILAGIPDGATVVSSAAFLVDAESNLGSAMQSMPGMDMGSAPKTPASGSMSRSSDTSTSTGAGGMDGMRGMKMPQAAPSAPHGNSGHGHGR